MQPRTHSSGVARKARNGFRRHEHKFQISMQRRGTPSIRLATLGGVDPSTPLRAGCVRPYMDLGR
jgi:hypothetical protein